MADTSPTNDGRAATFGRNLVNYIANRLPYASQQDDQLNTKYKYFAKNGSQRAEALAKASVTSSNPYNNIPIGDFGKDSSFQNVMYASLDVNKGGRLRDYRIMAAYSEVSDALDEICDECINIDENGRVATINYENILLTVDQKKELDDEFDKYIDYFELRSKGWQYFRQLMVEGEVFFELILHENYTKEGVLGLMNIPAEIVDPVYNNIQNMIVKGYIYKKPIFSQTQPDKVEKTEMIPMEQNQLIYVNSGIYNETKDFIIPFLENARRPYRQLSLIEDAIVIYRLVRAPERLVFNVDVGNMAPPKAEAYLRKLIQNYWSKKTFDNDQGDIVNKFNPQSMLDAFWFAKRQGSDGTSVSQLAGGANLGELSDLMYFIKKLYRSLKVPAARIDPEDRTVDNSTILRDELKFAKFIIRQQQRFAIAIKRGFITHLKLRGMWDELELKETNLEVTFNPPSNYFEMREIQKLELRANNFNTLVSNEFMSTTYAQKKYLNWKDRDILANREFLRKDMELQWELTQIQNSGPMWREQLAAAAGSDDAFNMAPGDDMGGGGGGAGGIPSFGGGPAEMGEAEGVGDIDADTGDDTAPATDE